MSKKIIAVILSLTCLFSLIFAVPMNVMATTSQDYMLQLVNNSPEEQGIFQALAVEEGKTYSIGFNYYNNGAACRFRVVRYDFGNLGVCANTTGNIAGRFYYEYTATYTGNVIIIIDNGLYDGTSNVWNISITEKGSNENLLSNINFENGTLGSWSGDAQWCSVVSFDDSAWNKTEYMVKVVNDGNNDQGIYQGVMLNEGETYVFSFDYYSESGAVRFKLRNNNFSQTLVEKDTTSQYQGTLSFEYTATYTGLHIPCYTNGYWAGTNYIWNVKCTKKDDDNNLLSNGNFLNGNFDVWEGNKELCTVVSYDESLWSKDYMLALTNDGTHNQGIWQRVNVEAGKKYIISFDYYSDGAYARLWLSENGWFNTTVISDTTTNVVSTHKYEYIPGVTGLTNVILTNGYSVGAIYLWNIKICEEGSDENLLVNSNFACGSITGWDCNNVYCTPVEYDPTLWEVQPDDYMLKIENNGTNNWGGFYQALFLDENTDYVFSFDYYAIGGAFEGRICGNTFNVLRACGINEYSKGTMTLEYNRGTEATGTGSNTALAIFSIDVGNQIGTLYVWNIRLTKKGEDENLLVNPYFLNKKINPWEDGTKTAEVIDFDSSIYANLVELDLDGDGLVTASDIVLVRRGLLIDENQYDINGDGVFDVRDLVNFKKKYIKFVTI